MSIVEELPSDEELTVQPDPKVVADTVRSVDVVECERLKKDGNELFGKGYVEEALQLYREAIKVAPIKPLRQQKQRRQGEEEEHQQDTPAASSGIDSSLPNSSNSKKDDEQEELDKAEDDGVDYTLTSQVFCNAGLCLSKLELYEEAVENLSEAIRHNKQYVKAYIRRAECYYALEKWSNAYGDYEEYEKLGGTLDSESRSHKASAKAKVDEEMQKMLGDLKNLGNRFLGYFGLSTDNFKFDKDPQTGGYSMRFENS
ncbi:TPR protein [Trypanosoma theileri]|uniref:TPR protein n=1 Tax=Trypanosoma theileri TaxID=67003 RepID=A0A1X0PA31_9TRYP|nr:TPR protein [Trypanosoma theileri]ORC93794.1 TPR protein [Trypanosoma theileri]